MSTSLSVVPMQRNFCMSSASTSMSVPSISSGYPVAETGCCEGPLSIQSEALSSHNNQLYNNKLQCAWHEQGGRCLTLQQPARHFCNHVLGVDVICCYLQPGSHWLLKKKRASPRSSDTQINLQSEIHSFIYSSIHPASHAFTLCFNTMILGSRIATLQFFVTKL